MAGSRRQAHSILRSRLEARRKELEQALIAKAVAIADPHLAADPAYAEGLANAISAALDFGLATIESKAIDEPTIPVVLLAQARIAARNGIGIDIVLRRYVAGHSVLMTFMLEEASRNGSMTEDTLHRLMTTQSSHFERLLIAIGEEHSRESEKAHLSSSTERRAALVKALLAGEPIETTELPYEFDAWHLGFVVVGPGAAEHLRELTSHGDQRVLVVANPEGSVWAWCGSRRRPDVETVIDQIEKLGERRLTLAVGEPAEGIVGWRLTHRQAAAAFPLALRLRRSPVRYLDVGLVASVFRDHTLTQSLYGLYVAPWLGERDSATLRTTLRAYFAAEQNVSSAASALGVKRHTVTNRLRRVEDRLGRPIGECFVELATALRVEEVANLAN